MANLLYGSKLNASLEDIITVAESYILLMCPYLKLHEKIKDCLKSQIENPEVQIVVVFGKNEEDPSKSLHKEDYEFLKLFPNVIIGYEKRLHAKYYANEKSGLITSLNIHTYSLDNNIEAGVFFSHKGLLKSLTDKALNPLTSIISDTEDIATEANTFFATVLNNAEKVFEKQPKFETNSWGFSKKFIGAEILVDNTSRFFSPCHKGSKKYNNIQENITANKQEYYKKSSNSNTKESNGYSEANNLNYQIREYGFCIRTKEQIPFQPSRPLSRQAYQTWAEFGNPEYREKYCHSCGNPWSTSVRRPICNECEG